MGWICRSWAPCKHPDIHQMAVRLLLSLAAIRVFLSLSSGFILQPGDGRLTENGIDWKGPVLGFSIKNSLNEATTYNGAPWKSFSRANIQRIGVFFLEKGGEICKIFRRLALPLFSQVITQLTKTHPPRSCFQILCFFQSLGGVWVVIMKTSIIQNTCILEYWRWKIHRQLLKWVICKIKYDFGLKLYEFNCP